MAPFHLGRAKSPISPLLRYLAFDLDWPVLTDALPWRSDPHLAQCIAAFPGLRILRQPFGDTLLGFLCSATKQIVQIKQMIALLAERHGLPGDWPGQTPAGQQAGTVNHRLPDLARTRRDPRKRIARLPARIPRPLHRRDRTISGRQTRLARRD